MSESRSGGMSAVASRLSLSVVVITKNEEHELSNFLKNFEQIADEIVIVDDGSTDGTAAIARAAGNKVRFVESPRADGEGFCDQRNKGLLAARGDWVLQVDCDMRLTPPLAHEIIEAIADTEKRAYRFRLRQYFLNHEAAHGGFQYWNQPWLARREAVSWTQKVHERIHIAASPEQIGQLQHRMVHLNDQDFSERLKKNHTYSHMEAERLLAAGQQFPLWKLVLVPLWRAIRAYVVMGGFRDGKIGFVWALYQFTSNCTIQFLGWERTHRRLRDDNEPALVDWRKGAAERKTA